MPKRRNILRLLSLATVVPFFRSAAFGIESNAPSRTARATALHRATHQMVDCPLVFEDPLAVAILGPQRARWLEKNLSRFETVTARAMRAFLVTRSRYAEDQLGRLYESGVRQYIALGAGLDTFAYRNPYEDLRVFEVDHPATQTWKREHLHGIGIDIPSSVAYVPVDFESDDLPMLLEMAGFDRHAPAFISWLGVTMYLTRDAVESTLRLLANFCAPASEIVFDFSVPESLLDDEERAARSAGAARVAKIGEPWITDFHPDTLAEELTKLGFADARSFGAAEANERYFTGRQDSFRFRGSARIMTARL